jgi:type I restriction enzyme S subunit
MGELLEYQLDEIATVIDCEHKTAPRVESSNFYSVRTPDISNGRIDYANCYRVDEETYNLWTRRGVPEPGDIVLAREAPVGEVGLIQPGYNVCLGQRTVLIKVNKEVADSGYLIFYLSAPPVKRELREQSGGSVVSHLNMKDIRAFRISLPNLPEQRAIASVLSSLDAKIDLLHRQNKTLEALAETLFRQWFVVRNAADEAEEGWVEGKLPDEFDFTMGQSPPGSSFNEDGIGLPMYQGNADFGFRFPKRRVYTTDSQRTAEPFDTLISVRAPVGEQNMARETCSIGRGVAAFRYRKNKAFYTYTYFKLRSMMEGIKRFNDEGTIFGSIGKNDFKDLDIVIPSDSAVAEYEQQCKPINDRVVSNCTSIDTLTALRDTLLPKLMSGEVRVVGLDHQ